MKILTFGEMMLRLKPLAFERILQTNTFEAAYGGAEANVAVSLALLGHDAAYLSKFPENPLGDANNGFSDNNNAFTAITKLSGV